MRKKVAFVTFYFEAWDSLAEVYTRMVNDPRFEVLVVAIPRKLTGDASWDDASGVSDFFAAQGIDHLIGSADASELRDWAPDYVFINYPWQRNYQPGYRVEQLSEFTKVCYVPYYSLALVNEPGEVGVTPYLYTQRSNQLASLVFTQDSNTVDAYATTSRGNDYVHLTGTPKIDSLVRKVSEAETEWPLNNLGNRKMVWAPHHSFSESWFNFGMFTKMSGQMLHFAKTNPNLDIVMRPHPIMFGNLVSSGVRSAEELETWLTEWNSLSNTAIDSEGDIAPLFAAADIFVTDGISFLGEYPLATGKPTVFFENEAHWPWSPIGKIAARANIHVHNFDEFVEAYNNIAENGLPDFGDEIAELQKASQPFPGEAAAKIVDVVLKDFEAQTPLVDKTRVTEIAWELKPEAELAWD